MDAVTRISVEVKSADGNNTQTYTVAVRRLGGGGPSDTTLATLSLSDIEFNMPFSASQRGYTATVDYGDADDG